MVATAVWLIVLTIIVVGSIPVLLIWLTTFPHTKLLIGTFPSLFNLYVLTGAWELLERCSIA